MYHAVLVNIVPLVTDNPFVQVIISYKYMSFNLILVLPIASLLSSFTALLPSAISLSSLISISGLVCAALKRTKRRVSVSRQRVKRNDLMNTSLWD